MISKLKQDQEVKVYFEDESRIGLITTQRRRITLKGVKPIGYKQYQHQSFWFYGAVEPYTGDSFFLELPTADTQGFQYFLDAFSAQHPDCLNLLFLDQARFHSAQDLIIPEHLLLVPLPPHSPELNPMERVWEYLKDDIAWELFRDLSHLSDTMCTIIQALTKDTLKSLTYYPYIKLYFEPETKETL